MRIIIRKNLKIKNMKKLFQITAIIYVLIALIGMGYLIGHKKGYQKGYIDRSNSMIQVRFPNGATAESIDSIENYGY